MASAAGPNPRPPRPAALPRGRPRWQWASAALTGVVLLLALLGREGNWAHCLFRQPSRWTPVRARTALPAFESAHFNAFHSVLEDSSQHPRTTGSPPATPHRRGLPARSQATAFVAVPVVVFVVFALVRGRLKPQQRLSPLQPLSLSVLYGSRQPLQLRAADSKVASPDAPLVARAVSGMTRPIRLPVWPVVNGLVLTLLDLLRLRDLAVQLESWLGGRVAPMMLDPIETDPFILLVHHRHRFDFWDPIRPLFRLLLPEGFPAHPHRGFETVTMTLQGGLTHRDSFGTKQVYGDGDVQWLTAGRGMLHEEMWSPDAKGNAELYQLWVNLPRAAKMAPPAVQILGTGPSATVQIPEVVTETATVRVIAGQYGDALSPARTFSPLLILHATLQPESTWTVPLPGMHTCLLYVREGQVLVGPTGAAVEVPAHHLATLDRGTGSTAVVLQNGHAARPADVLLLAGRPLGEPVVASGTWVMSEPQELQQADRDYSLGRMGLPWPHTLSDEQWRAWVRENGLQAGRPP